MDTTPLKRKSSAVVEADPSIGIGVASTGRKRPRPSAIAVPTLEDALHVVAAKGVGLEATGEAAVAGAGIQNASSPAIATDSVEVGRSLPPSGCFDEDPGDKVDDTIGLRTVRNRIPDVPAWLVSLGEVAKQASGMVRKARTLFGRPASDDVAVVDVAQSKTHSGASAVVGTSMEQDIDQPCVDSMACIGHEQSAEPEFAFTSAVAQPDLGDTPEVSMEESAGQPRIDSEACTLEVQLAEPDGAWELAHLGPRVAPDVSMEESIGELDIGSEACNVEAQSAEPELECFVASELAQAGSSIAFETSIIEGVGQPYIGSEAGVVESQNAELQCIAAPGSSECAVSGPPKVFLVVGECGDGKSTLINALRDPERSGEADAGLSARGVTKAITAYVGLPINGHPVDFLDTPGVGDTDVTPMKVLTMIESELITDDIHNSDAIDGVIVTTPIPDGRVKLGAQLVKLLVQHGFVGESKWRNVILVGTKVDRATEEEIDLFGTDRVDESGRPVGIAAQFFADAPWGTGTFVMTKKTDYSQLREAIAALPHLKVQYGTPDPMKMAEAFSEKLGVDKEIFQKELLASRETLQKELTAQFAERELAMKRDLEALKLQHQADIETQDRKSAEERESLRREIAESMKAKARVNEEMRLCTAPEERARLEKQAEEMQEQLKQAQKQQESIQQHWNLQLAEKEQQLKRLMRQIEEKEQDAQRARNYSFAATPAIEYGRRCLHPRSRNWGNASGKGRKCLDCRAELGR